jgi:hypothetical protein
VQSDRTGRQSQAKHGPPQTQFNHSFWPSRSLERVWISLLLSFFSSFPLHQLGGKAISIKPARMVEQASISPTPTTATTSTTSVSTSASSTPTTPTFPSIGDAFKTREELSTLIKGNGKAIGYIFKCSVTSEHKVTYYCSNQYHSPRCMAGELVGTLFPLSLAVSSALPIFQS